jgi:hypothetical protein
VVEPGLKPLVSNLLKTFYINVPLPPVKAFTAGVHALIGYDIYSPNSDFTGSLLTQSGLKFLAPHKDFVGAPIHVLLFVLGSGLLGWVWWRQ